MVRRWSKAIKAMMPILVLAFLLAGLMDENQAADGIPPLPPGLPRHVFLDKVPHFYQRKDECGPTALGMVLRYWHVPVTREAVDVGSQWQPGQGASTRNLIKVVTSLGLKVRSYSGNLAELMKNLAQMRPVIVGQWFNEKAKQFGRKGHLRVAIGYDYDQQVVFIRDPSPYGPSVLGFKEFLNLWNKNFMIVITK